MKNFKTERQISRGMDGWTTLTLHFEDGLAIITATMPTMVAARWKSATLDARVFESYHT